MYIHIYRERDGCVYIHTYIYIYTYMYTHIMCTCAHRRLVPTLPVPTKASLPPQLA